MDVNVKRLASETDIDRIRQFNPTQRRFPNVTLQELIEKQIDRHGSETAILCDHDKLFCTSALTFGQLNEKANQIANLLRAEGARPGHFIGIMAERSCSMMIGLLGILKAGGAYLPLDYR